MELTKSSQWQRLCDHYQAIKDQHMLELFKHEPGRVDAMSIEACGLYLDYSKNRVQPTTLELLMDLARSTKLEQHRDRMFAGEKINHTEDRAVLHTALRKPSDSCLLLDEHNIITDIQQVYARMRAFVEALQTQEWLGYGGKPIRTVINIGIGGSHLGPQLATQALQPYAKFGIDCHFVSNVDGYHINQILSQCQADETLFIISSKSFTTTETCQNADTARAWFLQQGADEADVKKHFVAVSANVTAAREFGIAKENVFPMWDWVGGRYSLWSAIGLPVALSVGMDAFMEMLEGAYQMDQHFQEAPLEGNMPVIMGLLGVWYSNFFQAQSQAVIPYDERLASFPSYLQQLDMESNGKSVDRDGHKIDYTTGPVIWGSTGTNCQHAYFQLLHQGTSFIPVDFILARTHQQTRAGQHRSLLANCLAQSEALMLGKTRDQVELEFKVQHNDNESLLPYCEFKGNRPSNTLMLDALTPQTLGALIALYEHKVFVQGIIWNINSFDQWGVEYGKRLAAHVEARLMDPESKLIPTNTDQGNISASTESLIQRINSAPHNS